MNSLFWNMSKHLWERNSFDDFYKMDPLKLEKDEKKTKRIRSYKRRLFYFATAISMLWSSLLFFFGKL